MSGAALRWACMPRESLTRGTHRIAAVQPSEIEAIRRWRNAQMVVLRQSTPIEPDAQVAYYAQHIWPSMAEPRPANLLLSLFEGDAHVGYCGLVHMAWAHARAEVSFLLDPALTTDATVYRGHHLACLALLRTLAFEDLRLHRLFTETWGFRTAHMENLEAAGFRREGTCREHLWVDGQRQDVVFHGLLRSDDVG